MEAAHRAGPRRAPRGRRRISWGVCEVPGWGLQLPPERVLAEMAALGLHGDRARPAGLAAAWTARAARAVLDRHGLRLVGGFVPVIVHEPELDDSTATPGRVPARLAEAGGELFVAAAVQDPGVVAAHAARRRRLEARRRAPAGRSPTPWPPRASSSSCTRTRARSWRPRGTSSTPSPTRDVAWCFDTGHLLIGGVDPARFVRDHGDRIGHVHFKDVDARARRAVHAQ